ncbi:MAG TPA: hypothetical protein VG755_15615, partial [Nannocystaceae bacterium]|nr:hypothetical protein [Nannocystaceae bacterium]
MDATRPTPPRCTRCGAVLVAASGPPSIDDGLGAPPAFGGEGHAMGSTSGATLYGIVPDDSLEAPISFGGEDSGPLPSTRLRSSPSASGSSSDRIGIPRDDEDLISSGLFDSNSASDDNFGDLDLPMPGDDLDIDLPDVARGRAPQPLFAPPKQVGTSPRSSAPIAAPPSAR